MQIIDVKEKANHLLSRKEIEASISFDSKTPSRPEIIKLIASKYNTKEELVVIKKIHGTYGKKQALVESSIYENEKARSAEQKHLVWRALPKEKRKEAFEAKMNARKERKKKRQKQKK